MHRHETGSVTIELRKGLHLFEAMVREFWLSHICNALLIRQRLNLYYSAITLTKGKMIDMLKVDLRGVDLMGADLRGADLSGTDLRGNARRT